MTLKYQTDNLDGLSADVQALYSKGDDGTYTLKVDGVVPQSKFQEANQRAVDAADEAARRRRTIERVTGTLGVENAGDIDSALEALKAAKGGKSDEAHQAVIDQMKAHAAAREAELAGQITAMRADGAKSQFKAALMSAGFGDKVADMVAASNMGRVTFDDEGKMRIMTPEGRPLAGSGADGFATIGDLSTQLAADLPELLTDKGKGGGSKPPASNTTGKPGNDRVSAIIGDLPER
jgi:hypothetical protein